MALEIANFTDLDENDVTETRELLATMLAAYNSRLDFRAGPLHDILLHIRAVLQTGERVNWDRLRRSMSLAQVTLDPTLADETLVDQLVSNYRITRRAGVQSTGILALVLAAPNEITVATGSVFVANGLNYVTTRLFIAKSDPGAIITAADRLLVQRSDGNYAFTVEVVAELPGPDYRVRQGTSFVPAIIPTGFVKAYATGDFTDGAAAETNADLVDRALLGLTEATLASRTGMRAYLDENYPEVLVSSILGMDNAEMTRDQQSIFPVSLGARCDWYLRTALVPLRVVVTKSCTLIAKTATTSTWQFVVDKDDLPGWYDVPRIVPEDADASAASFAATVASFSLDFTGFEDWHPLLEGYAGAGSRYQKILYRFTDTTTPPTSLTVGDRKNYDVTLRGLPLLATIQDALVAEGVRGWGGDTAVLAPVPCFVTATVTLETPAAGGTLADPAALKSAMAAHVNGLGFGRKLTVFQVSQLLADQLPAGWKILRILLLGSLQKPDGTIVKLASDKLLEIPESAAARVTAKTVCFFMEPEDITLNVTTP